MAGNNSKCIVIIFNIVPIQSNGYILRWIKHIYVNDYSVYNFTRCFSLMFLL